MVVDVNVFSVLLFPPQQPPRLLNRRNNIVLVVSWGAAGEEARYTRQ